MRQLSVILAASAIAGTACLFPTESGQQYQVVFTRFLPLVFLGDTASVEAVVVDSDGQPRPDIAVNYRSQGGEIVEVEPRTGLMRGVREGVTAVVAFAPGWEDAVPATDTVQVLVGTGSGIVNYGPRTVRFGDTVTVVGSDLDPEQLASLVFGGVGYGVSEIVHRFAQGDRDTLVLWTLPPAPTETSLLLVRDGGSAVVLPVQVEQTDVLEPNGDGTPRRLAAPFHNPGLVVTRGDVDVYEVPVGAGTDVTVTLTAETLAGVELSVRRASTSSAIWPASNRTLCRGAGVFGAVREWPVVRQRVALRPSQADTLILRIVGREISAGQSVRYGLAVDTTYLSAAAIDAAEENDWCEAALPVPTAAPGDTIAPTDTSMVLTFDNAPDLDWIGLDLDRSRVLTVWADPDADGPVPDLYLFRDNGDTLLIRGQRAAHDTATADLDSLAVSISAGTHLLLVTNAAVGEPGSAAGPYSLRVRTERPVIASVDILSGPFGIRSGLTTRLATEARDQLGGVVQDAALVWASTDTAAATVLQTGLVSAELSAEGTASAYITVRSADFPDAADSVPVTVVRDDIVWTWLGGNSTPNQRGVHGTRGVPSGTNIPGARAGAASWVDANGHLWLFGGLGWDGSGNPGALNDLWRFDGVDWTWVSGSTVAGQVGVYGVKGQPDPGNMPGGRAAAVSWIDSNGDLWLFGGNGWGAAEEGFLNDLWRFDGNSWTWVAGSQSVNTPPNQFDPGARSGAVGWIDAQDGLWVFGGKCCAPDDPDFLGWRRDVWLFNGATWELRIADRFDGDYNALGATGNPGPRTLPAVWQDPNGDVWLFGGEGRNVDVPGFTPTGRLNDLWQWNGSVFRWMAGDSLPEHAAVYGLGVPTDSTDPGARSLLPVSWTGTDGSLWLFGGEAELGGVLGIKNDLWRFDGARWAWMAGNAAVNRSPVFGTMGVGSVDNTPGARTAAVSWTDAAGNLWMFGGGSFANDGTERYWNDLWRIEP